MTRDIKELEEIARKECLSLIPGTVRTIDVFILGVEWADKNRLSHNSNTEDRDNK